jgi:hypothetical protein
MPVNNLVGDLTRETINFVYTETKRRRNKKKIQYVIKYITSILFAETSIKPYLYTILSILILGFVMNCFQFYYYIKLFLKNNKNLKVSGTCLSK